MLASVSLIQTGPKPGDHRRRSLTIWLWSVAVWLLVIWAIMFMLGR